MLRGSTRLPTATVSPESSVRDRLRYLKTSPCCLGLSRFQHRELKSLKGSTLSLPCCELRPLIRSAPSSFPKHRHSLLRMIPFRRSRALPKLPTARSIRLDCTPKAHRLRFWL